MFLGRKYRVFGAIFLALPISLIIGYFLGFHWGYLAYCAQCVIFFTWQTLCNGKPRFLLYLILALLTIAHIILIALIGDSLRQINSFLITLIFIVDYVFWSYVAGSFLNLDDDGAME